MAVNTPDTASEIDQRAKIDVGRELATSNPFLRNSWLGALVTAFSNRIFDFYFALKEAEKEGIPDTAIVKLEQWASIWDVLRNAATISNGKIALTGTAPSSIVPIGATFTASDDKEYITTTSGAISTQSLSCTISSVSSVATLITSSDHLLASNVKITVTGAVETNYNVTASDMTVTGPKTLTYTIVPTGSPATGTILLGFDSVSLSVDSVAFGSDQDQLLDAALSIQTPIAGVDDAAQVDFGTLGGGSDQETDTELRVRFIVDTIRNPIAHFNVSDIVSIAKTITGVTRVFVEEITPQIGNVTIYFTRDNDISPIPSGAEVAAVKAIVDSIKPANTDTLDVIVSAPDPITQAFTFTDLQPATASMQNAVTDSLEEFFKNKPIVGEVVDEDAYRSAIFNTVDTTTGDVVTTFTLSDPPTDIAIISGELAILGSVSYS